jgi:OOP family OmpA-OmpF porin
MSADGDVSYRRYRRRILGWGAAALVFVFVIGATVTLTRVEDDLEGQIIDRLDNAGLAGVRVSFSGQDGTLTCTAPLDEPDALVEVAAAVSDLRGVRSIELAGICVTDAPTGAAPTTTDTANPDSDGAVPAPTEPLPDQTMLELIATDPQFSALHLAIGATGLASLSDDSPVTLFAPSNEAFDALTPDQAGRLNADPELLAAILEQHVVADELMFADIEKGSLTTIGGSRVVVSGDDDEVILRSAGTTATVTDADLVMSDGIIHVVDGLLVPARLRLDPVDPAAEAASRAAALQIDLDGIVDATRIGFAPGSVKVSILSVETLDRVADAIIGRPGVDVAVRGHVDSGGTDLADLFVSTARAQAVVEQLLLRGVQPSRLTAVGMGATEPVVVDGVEDRVASRRVDFLVGTE